MKQRKWLALSLAAAMVASLGAGISTMAEEQSATAKDTLVIRVASDNGTIDYHNSTADNVTRLRSLICNSLMEAQRTEDGNIEFVAGDESIASEYVMDEDYMGITFTIRDGVKFSNGYDMTTSDVAFSIRLYEGMTGFEFIDYANITTTDTTVYVPFVTPNASVYYFLGVMIPIYSEQYYEELGGEDNVAEFYSTSAVGTGPYVIDEWVSGDYISLKANENYFAGAPIIENVRIRMIAETSVALMELETGGVDMVIDPGTTDVEDVLAGNHPGVTCWENMGTQQYMLGFNCAGPLESKELREAICYAIDRDAINETVYGVGAYSAPGIASLMSEGALELGEDWPYTYDPEKAVEMRNAAGYGEGEVELTYLVGGGDQARTAVGEMIAYYLNEVGITMNIVNVDKSAWASMIKESSGWDVQLRGISSVDTTYLDYYTNLLPQTGHYENDEASGAFTEAMSDIAATMDSEARIEKWQEFQKSYLTDYLYSYPLSQVNDYTLVNDKLQGAEKISMLRFDLKDAYFTE